MPDRIAIIPARGGSKRIPQKNTRLFLGKPIITYSLEAAQKSELFSRIIVSTDDLAVKGIADSYGAEVHERSKESANDFATISDVIIEVLNDLKIHQGEFCLLYATAPFVTNTMLMDSYNVFSSSNASTLLPVVRFSFPIQRALMSANGRIKMIQPEFLNTRSQDLPAAFHDAGLFFWSKVSDFLTDKKVLMDNTVAYELSDEQVQDIDNESDWKIAELKYELLRGKNNL